MPSFEITAPETGTPIKLWVNGHPAAPNTPDIEQDAKRQLLNVANLPFVAPHVAVMPDVHVGKGATIGSVIPTRSAVIPAAVGVDIGCGMCAVQTSLKASQLPDSLAEIRRTIEQAVPHGKGAHKSLSPAMQAAWAELLPRYKSIIESHPKVAPSNGSQGLQLGTLGSGNHFIEICLDERDNVWVMLHSGSRGIGNRLGMYFIELARGEMARLGVDLPDRDLSYLQEGTQYFNDYWEAVSWAQDYAAENRRLMLDAVIASLRQSGLPPFTLENKAVNCHHNYVSREIHFGEELMVTRKGAVRAGKGDLGIIPGSMGTRSYIVEGLGNEESFQSCSHGAGRRLSRTQAKARFSLEDHIKATRHVECRKDEGVLDETPMAYKDIDQVMANQQDLVRIRHTLRQIICVKG